MLFLQNYANKVKISSKLVTRITRLPFQADVRKVEYQVSQRIGEKSNLRESRHLFMIFLLADPPGDY